MKIKLNKNILCVAVLFLAGLSLLLYPFVANQWNNYRQSKLIGSYEEEVAQKEALGEINYQTEKEEAVGYNQELLPSILPDSFAAAEAAGEDAAYMKCLNITGNGIMGTVEIPKIRITLPIFHTTKEEVLEKAAGHLEGSSLPIGGEDSHAVISAHRGLPSASLFTDLDKIEEKDHFLLHILEDTLCYEVDKISVVDPDDTKDLAVEDGMDLVTLLTCTPYGINSQRLLVRGHRVPYEPELLRDEKIPLGNISLHTNYLLWVIVGILITAVFAFFMYRREKQIAAQNGGENSKESNPPVLQVKKPEEWLSDTQVKEPEEWLSDTQAEESEEWLKDAQAAETQELDQWLKEGGQEE